MMPLRGTVLVLLAFSLACTRPGPVEGRRACATWKDDVRAELSARCVECHDGTAGAGGYDLSTYNGALGAGSDAVPNAVAGDRDSRLLVMVRAGSADAVHREFTDLHALLEEWTVECSLAHGGSGIHAQGYANPADPAFHGTELRNRNWDMTTCQRCHGADFSGGPSGQSCLECHREGPTGCATCHAKEPTTGAHVLHRTAPTTGHTVDCTTCHNVPADWRAPGHVFLADGSRDPAPADVRLVGDALRDVHPERREGAPAFDGVGCSNVACHGDTLGDTSVGRTFYWQRASDAPATSCARCHGLPPSSHAPGTDCVKCHEQVVDNGNRLVNRALHLDGVLQVGSAAQDCQACHKDNPFTDTLGRTDPTLRTVGAHEAHLRPRTFMSAPVPCSGCHVVPERVGAAGHIDFQAPAELFNWPAGSPGIGGARGAAPEWNVEGGSCSATYCHGGGTMALTDTSPSVTRTVPWTPPGQFRVLCGSCHGVPPADVNHDDSMSSVTCVQCHPGTVDSFGIITFQPDGSSLHVNGVVDVVR